MLHLKLLTLLLMLLLLLQQLLLLMLLLLLLLQLRSEIGIYLLGPPGSARGAWLHVEGAGGRPSLRWTVRARRRVT